MFPFEELVSSFVKTQNCSEISLTGWQANRLEFGEIQKFSRQAEQAGE